MEIADLLSPDRVVLGLAVRDKAGLLAELARRAGATLGIPPPAIVAALQAREQLGSTGLGRGFALPHTRLPGLSGFFGLFARLGRPIPFQAIDEKPVDLVFLLLIPERAGNEHVGALAAISRALRDPAVLERLRRADSADAVWRSLAGPR
jgi:PTS system nitrogen regulatory IIA component